VFGSEQWKLKYLKATLSNSLKIQKKLLGSWLIPVNIWDYLYLFLERILLLLPSRFVFWLFKKTQWLK